MQLCSRCLFYSYLLNIFDMFATLSLISQFGIEAEGNPIGRYILQSPQSAVVCKVFVTAAFLFVIWLFRQRRSARIGAYTIFFAYILLTAYHIYILTALS